MEQKHPVFYVFAVIAGVAVVFLLVVAKESVEAVRDRILGEETPHQIAASNLLATASFLLLLRL